MVENHLMFADDMCVFSPSFSGMQCFLNIWDDYAAEHEISFNCNKTSGVFFVQKCVKNLLHQTFFDGVRVQFLTK